MLPLFPLLPHAQAPHLGPRTRVDQASRCGGALQGPDDLLAGGVFAHLTYSGGCDPSGNSARGASLYPSTKYLEKAAGRKLHRCGAMDVDRAFLRKS